MNKLCQLRDRLPGGDRMWQWVDVLGLHVRVSSWANLSGSCLGPSDNYSESPFQHFLRTREKYNPWSISGVTDSRMDSHCSVTRGAKISSLFAQEQLHFWPVVKCCAQVSTVHMLYGCTDIMRPPSLIFCFKRARVYKCSFYRCGNCDTLNVLWVAYQVAIA